MNIKDIKANRVIFNLTHTLLTFMNKKKLKSKNLKKLKKYSFH